MTSYETAIDDFLKNIGKGIFRKSVLDKIWKAFMAYCMCIIINAFKKRGYTVKPQNHSNGFIFKLFPQGDPDNYSYFIIEKDEKQYEVRLNIYVRNARYKSLRLNLDVVVINSGSISSNEVDSEKDLITFAECKNMRGFPELVATIEGMVYELQRPRLYQNAIDNFKIPCCLLLSGSGNSIRYIDDRFKYRRMSIRIFDLIQPGNPNIRDFIDNWF